MNVKKLQNLHPHAALAPLFLHRLALTFHPTEQSTVYFFLDELTHRVAELHATRPPRPSFGFPGHNSSGAKNDGLYDEIKLLSRHNFCQNFRSYGEVFSCNSISPAIARIKFGTGGVNLGVTMGRLCECSVGRYARTQSGRRVSYHVASLTQLRNPLIRIIMSHVLESTLT